MVCQFGLGFLFKSCHLSYAFYISILFHKEKCSERKATEMWINILRAKYDIMKISVAILKTGMGN